MRSVDAEKIKVEVKGGDLVVMLSDGAASSVEDSAWLLTFLTKEDETDLEEYAKRIALLAAKHNAARDDITVSLVRIIAE